MNKINWIQKLSSRKFWAALIGFVTAILFAFKVAETDITQIAGIITAGSTLVIYILTEGYVDANRNSGSIKESGNIIIESVEELKALE